MGNKILTYVLVVIVAVLVGIGLAANLKQIKESQSRIESALLQQEGSSDVNVLMLRLAQVEAKVSSLETRLNNAPTQQVQPAPRDLPPQPDLNKVYDIPVAHTPVIGPKNAKVTIVEFVDFQCPFCTRFHPPIKEVLNAYPKDVNYIVKNFPLSFHPNARPASKVALAANEQGKYWEMVDKLLENSNNLSEETYRKIATDLGLNVDKLFKDLKDNDQKYEKMIQDDMQLGAQVDVQGTPSFYINGKVTFARDFASWKKEIDAILGK